MLEILKELLKIYKVRKEEAKYRAELLKMPLNFEALEHLVQKYRDRTITITIAGGNTIKIEHKEETRKSFREQWQDNYNIH